MKPRALHTLDKQSYQLSHIPSPGGFFVCFCLFLSQAFYSRAGLRQVDLQLESLSVTRSPSGLCPWLWCSREGRGAFICDDGVCFGLP